MLRAESMLSFDILVVFVKIHTPFKKCGLFLWNHEGLQFSLFSDFLLNNLSGIVHILINVGVFSAVYWHVISCFGDSKLGSLLSGISCEWLFCSFMSGLQFENLGVISVCSQKQQVQQLAWLCFVGFEQSVAHTGIAKCLESWMMTCVKQGSKVVVLCTLTHPGTHSSKIRGVDCLIGETELN